MRLLLDQNTPRGLIRLLEGHEVVAAARMGWSELGNGELLAAAEAAGFDVLVTCDRNIRYQQNLTGRRIGVVVLATNTWDVLREYAGLVRRAVGGAHVGSFEEVEFPLPTPKRRGLLGGGP